MKISLPQLGLVALVGIVLSGPAKQAEKPVAPPPPVEHERAPEPDVSTPVENDSPVEEPEEQPPEILYFSAKWCGACQTQGPVIEELERRGYVVRKVDVDEQPELKREHGVTHIPTYIFGEERIVGSSTADAVEALCKPTYKKAAITTVRTDDGARGTAVCIGRLDTGEYLFGLCHHQVDHRGWETDELNLLGTTGRVVWKNSNGDNDAAIVAVRPNRDIQVGTLYKGEYRGRATVFGYPGTGRRLRSFSGDVQVNPDHGLVLTSPIPRFARQGMSGGGVYAPDGRLAGIFNGFITQSPSLNCFTPSSVYAKAIEELGGVSDVALLPPEAQPTPHREVDRILKILKPRPDETFVDYGCGNDARFVIAAVRDYGCRGIGIEIDPGRAESARQAVENAVLSERIEIIEGDARTVDVEADVGVVFLWPEMLSQLEWRLKQLDRFVSYQHEVPGLSMTNYDGAWYWATSAGRGKRPYAVWKGRIYHGDYKPRCTCEMCTEIRRQQGIPQPTRFTTTGLPVAARGTPPRSVRFFPSSKAHRKWRRRNR